MSTNKNALIRYEILDRCFSNFNRKYSFDDLLELVNEKLYDLCGVNVSTRQLRADIENLKNRPYNAPIETYPLGIGKQRYYRYADRDFSIFKNELTPEELANLRSTIEMLGRYRGLPSNVWLEGVISNLECRFGVKPKSDNVIEFEQNERLKGLEFLSVLIDVTIAHQTLKLTYRTYNGREQTTLFYPYYIKQYNSRWFVFGLERTDKHGEMIANKALDRIVGFEVLAEEPFVPNDKVDFKQFFNDIVGVTIPNEYQTPEEVVLKFDENRFPYIVSKPLHRTQVVVDEVEHTISIVVRPNKELISQILSFGCHVEVLSPQWLRQQIADNIALSAKKYSSL